MRELRVTVKNGEWRAISVDESIPLAPERVIHLVQLLTLSAIDHGLDLNNNPTWSLRDL